MNHLEDCNFEEIIKELQRGSWSSGSEEISGTVDIYLDRIHFSDGWDSYPTLEFKYCPVCGVKLINN